MTRIRGLGTCLALLTACSPAGSRSASSPSPASATPSTAPSPAPPLLVVWHDPLLLAQISGASPAPSPDAVTIMLVDQSGRAVSTSQPFTPRPNPSVPDAVAVNPIASFVAANAVYYMDNAGIVWRYDRQGHLSRVVDMGITSTQDAATLAVSPDGAQVAAAVLTYATPSGGAGGAATQYSEQLVTWSAARGLAVAHMWTSQSPPPQGNDAPANGHGAALELVAWDDRGPIGVVGSYISVQNDPLPRGHHFFAGRLFYVGLDGALDGVVGGEDCQPWEGPVNGRVLCAVSYDPGGAHGLTVRNVGGTVTWTPGDAGACLALSPDGSRVATESAVVQQSASPAPLPASFCPSGWVNDRTVVGVLGATSSQALQSGELATASVSGGAPADLGVKGLYLGVL